MHSALILVLALLTTSDLPCPKHIEPIKYPEVARSAHREGTVTAHVELDSEGRVARVSTEGQPILADAVEKWIKTWTFAVSDKNTTDIVVEFKLLGKPQWPANAETFVTYDLPDKATVVSQPTYCDHCRDSKQ